MGSPLAESSAHWVPVWRRFLTKHLPIGGIGTILITLLIFAIFFNQIAVQVAGPQDFFSKLFNVDVKLDRNGKGTRESGKGTCSEKGHFRIQMRFLSEHVGSKFFTCYKSQLDPYNVGTKKMLLPPLVNTDNEVAKVCAIENDEPIAGNGKQPQYVWHGFAVGLSEKNKLILTASFSNESFTIKMDENSKISINIGTNNSLFLDFDEKTRNMTMTRQKGSRQPDLDNFMKSSGILLVPLDMAMVKFPDGSNSRVLRFVIRGYGHLKYSPSVINVEDTSGNSVIPTFNLPMDIKAVQICDTSIVNAQPAVITDKFDELTSVCRNRGNCIPYADYAVRLGWLDVVWNSMDLDDGSIFAEALEDWVEKQSQVELGKWKGVEMLKYLINSDNYNGTKPKIPRKGQFYYISIDADWMNSGVQMIVHKCAGHGIFASAVRKREGIQSNEDLEKLCAWKEDFIFLDECTSLFITYPFLTQISYKLAETPANGSGPITLYFGTLQKISQYESKPIMLSQQQIEAHRFKYGLSSPIRNHKYVHENYKDYEKVRTWGRFFAHPDKMYSKYSEHKFSVKLRALQAKFLPEADPEFLDDATVTLQIRQMCYECGTISFYSTRLIGSQNVVYKTKGGKENSALLWHQISSFNLDGVGGVTPHGVGKDVDVRVVNVYDIQT